jgi:hypothetical protein
MRQLVLDHTIVADPSELGCECICVHKVLIAFAQEAFRHLGLYDRCSFYQIDAPTLRAISPDLILTQQLRDVCAVSSS